MEFWKPQYNKNKNERDNGKVNGSTDTKIKMKVTTTKVYKWIKMKLNKDVIYNTENTGGTQYKKNESGNRWGRQEGENAKGNSEETKRI